MIDRPVVLVGFMAAGKSTIGRLLAERLGLAFADTDNEIEAAFGKPIAQIFREDGEAQFREAEREVIARLMERGPQVLALGGGAFGDADTRETVNRHALSVWLDAPFETISARLPQSSARPLASSKSDGELRSLWHERRLFYKTAHIRIESSEQDPATIVEEIVKELGRT